MVVLVVYANKVENGELQGYGTHLVCSPPLDEDAVRTELRKISQVNQAQDDHPLHIWVFSPNGLKIWSPIPLSILPTLPDLSTICVTYAADKLQVHVTIPTTTQLTYM